MSASFSQGLAELAEEMGTVESIDDYFTIYSGPYSYKEANSTADDLRGEFPNTSVKVLPHSPLSGLNEYNARPVRDTVKEY